MLQPKLQRWVPKNPINDKDILNEIYKLYRNAKKEGTLGYTPYVAVATSLETRNFLLKREGDRIAGFIRYNIGKRQPVCRILQIYVVPKYRRRGLGRALVAELETIANIHKCECTQAKTQESNIVAQKFYEKLGYIKIEKAITKTVQILYKKKTFSFDRIHPNRDMLSFGLQKSGYFYIMGNLDWIMLEIKKRLPIYEKCVELCCGRGELIWHTFPPEGFEVLNDNDADITRLHKFVHSLTEKKLVEFGNRFDWEIKKETYNKLISQDGIMDDFEFAYRYLYLLGASTRDRTVYNSTFNSLKDGKLLKCVERIGSIKNRLKNVTITCMDAIECVKRFDSPDTFFFIDPPYPWRERYYTVHDLDWKKLYSELKNIEGKWMMIFDPTRPENATNNPNSKVAEQIIMENKHISFRQRCSMTRMYRNKDTPKYNTYFIIWSYRESNMQTQSERMINNLNRLRMEKINSR